VQHGDLGPWNLLWGADGQIVGVLDWELTGPASPLYDTGYLAWFTVPLMDDARARARGFPRPPERLARLNAFARGTDFRSVRTSAPPSRRSKTTHSASLRDMQSHGLRSRNWGSTRTRRLTASGPASTSAASSHDRHHRPYITRSSASRQVKPPQTKDRYKPRIASEDSTALAEVFHWVLNALGNCGAPVMEG
jgi:Phosphotransferase enzyme family